VGSPSDESDTANIQELLTQQLSHMPIGVDELARSCHLSTPMMQMALLEMELAGRLQRLPGNRIVLLDE
jgi:DNA processing protein